MRLQFGFMSMLSVHKGDITTLSVDAVVNAANSSLLGGQGVDGAIHSAGGPTIGNACRLIVERDGPCPAGYAVATTAGELEAAMVIHTVGPIWTEDEADGHAKTLASCYHSSLGLATRHQARSIAFPNISTGVYRFPKLTAAIVALNAVLDWLEDNPDHSIDEICFVCFDDENYSIYQTILRP